ncbi:RDD family protein [Methylotenera mobilis]|uniref:RDD domain containing protein n=1 Tax=Methylotenera mobilis (strain JLW8 / ATCC BAA-1282 / DSM 17540) TaxID=583345 RepID=C6WT48_METML|nr:RDD family protein [Methylotenera mobilis]ACT49110.1 RDD domain containing protein [Methylotenera mobilis JLW8]
MHPENSAVPTSQAPSLLKLSACLLYELLAIIALSLVFAGLFYAVFGDATHGIKRLLQQLLLWGLLGAYYIRCWMSSGQTLAMQAWHFRVVTENNVPLPKFSAFVRYLLASLSLVLFGLGFVWALVDKDRLFLHDRLLKSKIIVI